MTVISEAMFIHLGFYKERWPHTTPQLISGFLAEPDLLDNEDEDFVDCFWKYHEWYWRNQN
jgi:hypothetical protein